MTRILFKFIIYPSCERTLKNGRVKSKIVRKSSFGDMIFLTTLHYYFSFVFCIVPKKVLLLKYRKRVSHLKNRYHYAKVVENARIHFSISPYCTLFFAMARLAALWICEDIISIEYHGNIYLLLKNGHKSTQTKCKVCSNLARCTITIDFRLTSVFFINLEHLSHSTLVLLFIL